MGGLDEEQIKRIIKILEEKGALLPCPRCGNKSFSVLNGYLNQVVQTETSGLNIRGMSLPAIVTICSKCGFLSQHALGSLGLLPSNTTDEEKE